VQTLKTDSIEYRVETRTELDMAIRQRIAEAAAVESSGSNAETQVRYHSEHEYSLVLQGKTMTVAYKPY
jgi:hypothetical protein